MWINSYDPQSAHVSSPASSLPGCENPLKDMSVCFCCMRACVCECSLKAHVNTTRALDTHTDKDILYNVYLWSVYCMCVCVCECGGATRMGRGHRCRLGPPLGVLTPISKAHQESINTSGRGQRVRHHTHLDIHTHCPHTHCPHTWYCLRRYPSDHTLHNMPMCVTVCV